MGLVDRQAFSRGTHTMAGAEKQSRAKSTFAIESIQTTTRQREQHTEVRLRTCLLSLPAELRNNIYRLCLATGRVLAIKDMHPDEFQARKEGGRCPWRSTYTAPDHCRDMCYSCPGTHFRRHCSFTNPRTMYDLTTYIPGNALALENTTIAILAVNHQLRQEAGSLFYGSNIFNFGTMSSLVPFLKDRAPDTRKYIKSLQLELHVYAMNWYPSFAEHGRPQAWKRAFTALKKLPYLQLNTLRIKLDDGHCQFYGEGLKTHTPQMRWLHRLAEISTLDSLGVQYFMRCQRFISGEWYRGVQWFEQPTQLRGPHNARDVRDTQEELWMFLAPRMLTRVEGNSHEAETLQHRRIKMPEPIATTYEDLGDESFQVD